MDKIKVKIQVGDIDLKYATVRGSEFCSGFDIRAYLADIKKFKENNHKLGLSPFYDFDNETGELKLYPGGRVLIPTNIRLEIPPGYELQVRPRSGTVLKKGLSVANTPGTIDADYRGEVGVIVINLNNSSMIRIKHGERIAQGVFCKIYVPDFELVETVSELNTSDRGDGGFGSTDKKFK
jgi:dUTP pyrophosphatase